MVQTKSKGYSIAEQQLEDAIRPQSAGAAECTPRSPLSKFCKDKLSDMDKRLHAAIIHKVDLKEALEIERPRMVSRNPRTLNLTRAETLDCDNSGRPRSRSMATLEHRRLSRDEKDVNLQKAVDYFHKVKEANEMAEEIRAKSRAGTARRNSSTPCLGTGSRKGSKDSSKSSRRGSKDGLALTNGAAEEPAEDGKNPGKARARFLAALGMPQERKSLLALTAIKAIGEGGQAERRASTNGQIGGQIFLEKNNLLERLRRKRDSIAPMPATIE